MFSLFFKWYIFSTALETNTTNDILNHLYTKMAHRNKLHSNVSVSIACLGEISISFRINNVVPAVEISTNYCIGLQDSIFGSYLWFLNIIMATLHL